MKILLVNNTPIPALRYGGTERVIWWLGKELVNQGHEVSYLVAPGSHCPFAKVYPYYKNKPLSEQIPADIDFVHIHFPYQGYLPKPYMCTIHGYVNPKEVFDINTSFVSRKHAEEHHSDCYVYNGLGLEDYGNVDWFIPRRHLLFLARTSLKVKNLEDALEIANDLKEKIEIIGGWRLTFNPRVHYQGMLGAEKKNRVLNASKALLFPVRWHEPFGLAMMEALFFGCPVFGTPNGSLPELIKKEVGFLSNHKHEIKEALKNIETYNRKYCHQYVCDEFSSVQMTSNYLKKYEQVLNNEPLNKKAPFFGPAQSPPFLPLEN